MPSRRVVLIGGAGIAAVVGADLLFGPGHVRHDPAGARPAAPTQSSDPRDPTWAAAAADERSVIAAYLATTRARPELAETLAVPLAHHRIHLAALTGATAPAGAPTAPVAALPAPTAAVAAARRSALQALRAREAALSSARAAAVPGDLRGGGLLASIAACDAVHVDLLDAALAALPSPVAPPTSTEPPVTTSAPPTTTPTPTHPPAPTPSRRSTPPSPTRSTSRPPTTTATTSASTPTPTSSPTTSPTTGTPTTP